MIHDGVNAKLRRHNGTLRYMPGDDICPGELVPTLSRLRMINGNSKTLWLVVAHECVSPLLLSNLTLHRHYGM